MPKATDNRKRARARAMRDVATMSPEEDAAITAAALSDPDNPPLTEEFFKRARPAREVMPEIVDAYLRSRGRPKAAATKVPVTIRLDREVVAALRKEGPGWQTRLNDMLARRVRRGRKVA